MHRNHAKYKARSGPQGPYHRPTSVKLRSAKLSIEQEEYPTGLATLDTMLEQPLTQVEQTKVLAVAADASLAQGDYEEALNGYASALSSAADHPRAWFRPAFSRVRCLLRMGDPEGAFTEASTYVQRARTLETAMQAQILEAEQELAATGQTVVPDRPRRAIDIATRLGDEFLADGQISMAKALFLSALETLGNRKKTLRGLGTVAMREGENASAVDLLKQAISGGNYQVKTLACWPLLLTALHKNGTPLAANDPLVQDLAVQTPTFVGSRAALLIVSTLRKQGNPAWQQIAANWTSQQGNLYPIVKAELQKLAISTAKHGIDFTVRLQAANALLQTPKVSPKEFVNASREIVRASFMLGQAADINQLLGSGSSAYGSVFVPVLSHSLALVLLKLEQVDTARSMLSSIVQGGGAVPVKQWGRSLWALATLEKNAGNYTQAATLFTSFIEDGRMPVRLTLTAQIQWAWCVLESGSLSGVTDAQSKLSSILPQINDYDMALDLGFQLMKAPEDLRMLAVQFHERGKQLAIAAFQSSNITGASIKPLYHLARRQNDFGSFNEICATWSQISQEDKDALSSDRNDFWDYLSLVILSLYETGQTSQGDALAQSYLQTSATPTNGRVRISITFGGYQIRRGFVQVGINLYTSLVAGDPSHEYCAFAYYWLSVNARRNGDQNTSIEYARSIQRCLGTQPNYPWSKSLLMKSICLQNDLSNDINNYIIYGYDERSVALANYQINRDLQTLSFVQ